MEIGIGVGFRFGVGIADGNITGIGIGFGIIAKLTGFGIKKSTGIGFGIVEGGFTPGLVGGSDGVLGKWLEEDPRARSVLYAESEELH